ncbi:MAG: CsgG/HfaB family protein [Myxococcota bacterium]
MWLFAALVALVFAVEPPSLAVMPLAKGAGSAQYEGLGRALAGMLVTDLSALPGVRLVERDQLDALLAELKLKESGYLDPASAQKLGKGVGAQYVVIGSFTVIDPQFVLDARIVAVQSGEIVKAANAAGTVGDFVSVEKELVEGLAAGLDLTLTSAERRKLSAQVPTEKFAAFSAYGEGLAKQEAGDAEAAGAAYRRALAEDPAFEEAKRALDALSAVVAEVKQERVDAAKAAANAVHARVLAEIPDDRSRPAGFVHTEATWVDFAIRVTVLDFEARDCDVWAEMKSALDRADWKLPAGSFAWPIYGRMGQLGFDGKGIDKVRAHTFQELASYLTQLTMAGARCFPPERAAKEIDALRADVRKRGLDGEKAISGTLGPQMERLWATAVADGMGATPELTKRVKAMLAADPSREMEESVDRILKLAAAWERRRGVPKAEIARRVRLVADGKIAKTPMCAQAGTLRSGAVEWGTTYEKYERWWASPIVSDVVDAGLPIWIPASDLGCLEGVPARFDDPKAALAWLEEARKRVTCSQTGDLDAALALVRKGDAGELLAAYFAWTALVSEGCARD